MKLKYGSMMDYGYLTKETEDIRELLKEFQAFKDQNRPRYYNDFFKTFLRETEGIELELTEKHYDIQEFPKVLKFRNLRIPTGPLCSIEGVIRCCWGIAYHKLGYTKYHMESNEPYLKKLLENPMINTIGKAYLIGVAEKGYLEKLRCSSVESVNGILGNIGLRIEE